ncbi:MAG: hypothetical protein H7066_13920 [Cytophagaceae bacterium]|nr:hypothetical protein [Gemmatimonadaceae bacterium]
MSQTVRNARSAYYRAHGLPADGGISSPTVKYPTVFGTITLPNVESRKRALPLHDLHHIATGYDTSWFGEAEIAWWELGAGCHGFAAAWFLNFSAGLVGLVIAPRRSLRAWRRGLHSRSLYRTTWDDRWLDWTLDELRAFLALPPA